MMQLRSQSFQSHLGLASIEVADESSEPLLPQDSRLQPIEAAVERQLETLLQAETFEKVILDALRPRVRDQSMLLPSAFHALREEVLNLFYHAATANADPATAQDLQAAVALLNDLGAAHDLGEQYRYALLKG